MKKMKFSDCGDFERKLVNYRKFIGNQNPKSNNIRTNKLTNNQTNLSKNEAQKL